MINKIKKEINGWHFVLATGIFSSILFSLILIGLYNVNTYLAMLPIIFFIGAYELSSKIRRNTTSKSS